MSFSWIAARQVFLALLLLVLCRSILRAAVNPDLVQAKANGTFRSAPGLAGVLRGFMFGNGTGDLEAQLESGPARTRWQAPVLIFTVAVYMSMVSFDFVMALDAHWISNLFGLYFMACLILQPGFAATLLSGNYVAKRIDISKFLGGSEQHDVGKLTFAFTIFFAYMWFHVLTIYYGNFPTRRAS